MPDPNAPVSPAATSPADDATQSSQPAVDPAEFARIRDELASYKTREGRSRNEKGVMQARIRELEQLALSNGTGEPEYGQPNTTPAPYTPAYKQPAYQEPQTNFVSRDEFDLWRVERELNDKQKFETVRQIALDGYKVQPFVSWQVDPTSGQPFRSVYDTYKRIADHLELEELRKQQTASSPSRNPALGAISGSGAASSPEMVDVTDLTPEQMKEKFPEAFAPGGMFTGR